MTEIENLDNTVYVVVLSHGQRQVEGEDYLTTTSLQRVLGAVSRYEELSRQGFSPIVIFTGGMKPDAEFHTSSLMSDFFNSLTGLDSIAMPLSNETDGNIRTCFESIPLGTRVEVLSHSYHNLLGRVEDAIIRYKNNREVEFIGIEELPDNYLDTNFIPEKLRFSNAIEALQCILLPIAGKMGINVTNIYKNFSKIRSYNNRPRKMKA